MLKQITVFLILKTFRYILVYFKTLFLNYFLIVCFAFLTVIFIELPSENWSYHLNRLIALTLNIQEDSFTLNKTDFFQVFAIWTFILSILIEILKKLIKIQIELKTVLKIVLLISFAIFLAALFSIGFSIEFLIIMGFIYSSSVLSLFLYYWMSKLRLTNGIRVLKGAIWHN